MVVKALGTANKIHLVYLIGIIHRTQEYFTYTMAASIMAGRHRVLLCE